MTITSSDDLGKAFNVIMLDPFLKLELNLKNLFRCNRILS
jgi:hypothetical protein